MTAPRFEPAPPAAGPRVQGFSGRGFVVGTYSSIYVSSSMLIALGLKPQQMDHKAPAAVADAERVTRR